MSYLYHAFALSPEPPSASDARDYLLEGALFDSRPRIDVVQRTSGEFVEMTVAAPGAKHPIALRRLEGEAAEAARGEATDEAEICGDAAIASAIQNAPLVLEWEIFREEMDEDAWFALHLWQAWILERTGGWLYAPGDGIFDRMLKRRCGRAK